MQRRRRASRSRARARCACADASSAAPHASCQEMRRLLRQPRYFDADFEAAAQRCFRCGGSGHRERDCAAPPRERPCFLCGLFGHVSRECPNELCFNCARAGHQSRDCREPRGAAAATARCLRCGSQSHTVASCEREYDEEDMERMTCYLCGDPGHLCCEPAPREEDLPQNLSCFRCGDEGHAGFGCSARLAPSLGGRGGGQVAECACAQSPPRVVLTPPWQAFAAAGEATSRATAPGQTWARRGWGLRGRRWAVTPSRRGRRRGARTPAAAAGAGRRGGLRTSAGGRRRRRRDRRNIVAARGRRRGTCAGRLGEKEAGVVM